MMRFKNILIPQIGLIAIAFCAFLFLTGLFRSLEDGYQSVITFFLVLVTMFLPVICCINKKEQASNIAYDFFQPGVIVAIFYYIYILIPGIHIWYNQNYVSNWIQVPTNKQAALVNYTFLVCILGIISFGLGYRSKVAYAFVSKKIKMPMYNAKIKLPSDSFIKLIIVMLISVGLIGRLYYFVKVGGSGGYSIKYLSPSMSAELGIRIPGILVLISSCLDWGALLLLLRYIVTQRPKYLTVLIMLFAMVSTYLLSGKRSDVLPLFFFPLVWFHYLRSRISFSRGLVYLICGFILMVSLLFIRILGPVYVRDASGDIEAIGEIASKPVEFYLNSPELAVFDMTMVSILEHTHILKNIGGWLSGILNYNFSTVFYFIPRFFWEGKPIFRDLGQEFFQLFISDEEFAGFSVGIFASLYLFGGLIGVLLGMTVIGIIFRFLYVTIQPWRGDPTFIFIYPIVLWIIFQFFRFGTLGFTILFFMQKLLVGAGVFFLWLYVRRQTDILYRKKQKQEAAL